MPHLHKFHTYTFTPFTSMENRKRKKSSTGTVDNSTRLKKPCIVIDGPGNNIHTEDENLLEGLRQTGFSEEVCQAFEG